MVISFFLGGMICSMIVHDGGTSKRGPNGHIVPGVQQEEPFCTSPGRAEDARQPFDTIGVFGRDKVLVWKEEQQATGPNKEDGGVGKMEQKVGRLSWLLKRKG